MVLIDTTFLNFGKTGIGTVINQFINVFDYENISYKKISYFDYFSKKTKNNWYKYFNKILIREVKKLDEKDVFLFPENIAGFLHFGKYKCNTIFIIHDLFELECNCYILSKIKKYIFNHVLHNVDKIITVSNCSKKNIINSFPKYSVKIFILYPFYIKDKSKIEIKNDEIFSKFKNISGKNFILANGSGQSRKNASFLIKNANKIFNDFGLNIIFFGKDFNNDGYATINNEIKLYDCSERITHMGTITDAELSYLYQNAKCFIFPSTDEGFGLPPVEALLNNCKIAVSNIDIFKEVLSPLDRYFDFTYESLSENLKQILNLDTNDFNKEKEQILAKFQYINYKKNLLSILSVE